MTALLLLLLSGGDLVGPLAYDKAGVELAGRRTPWKDVASLTETDAPAGPEPAAADLDLLAADPFHKEALKRVKPLLAARAPKTALRPPFEGRWKAMPDATGHHAIKAFALHAIDFVKVDEKGRLFGGNGKALGDFLGYDQPVLAAADGEVVSVEDRFDDLPPGQLGKFDQANFITVKHPDGEFTFYGHVRKGSGAVKPGDPVKKGSPLARVGNSGASGTPHLHFTLLTPHRAGWISIPWRLHGFTLVDVQGAACSVDAKQARPQEGWTLLAPKP